MRKILLFTLGVAVLLSGCLAFTKEWYVMPRPIGRELLPPVSSWAGVAVKVVDARIPAQAVPRWVEAGLTWEGHSDALVQETRRAMLEALGPAQPDTDLELVVSIVEHVARFDSPSWVGMTTLSAKLIRRGVDTGRQWNARGRDVRWNWMGLDTAGAASQAAYETAVNDLLRQLALTRPPR